MLTALYPPIHDEEQRERERREERRERERERERTEHGQRKRAFGSHIVHILPAIWGRPGWPPGGLVWRPFRGPLFDANPLTMVEIRRAPLEPQRRTLSPLRLPPHYPHFVRCSATSLNARKETLRSETKVSSASRNPPPCPEARVGVLVGRCQGLLVTSY